MASQEQNVIFYSVRRFRPLTINAFIIDLQLIYMYKKNLIQRILYPVEELHKHASMAPLLVQGEGWWRALSQVSGWV